MTETTDSSHSSVSGRLPTDPAVADVFAPLAADGVAPASDVTAATARSAQTLKGLTYAPTGALLAASTTSLPETPHGQRNWDYRYAWVRDSSFALWSRYTLGLDREANDFLSFIVDVCGQTNGERHPLRVMYGVGGERTQLRAAVVVDSRCDKGRHPYPRGRRRRCLHPGIRRDGAGCLTAAGASTAIPARRRRAGRQDGANDCSRSPARSSCMPRRSARRPVSISAISRRRSPTWR